MRQLCLIVVLSIALISLVEAQTRLTIDDAIKLAHQNNLELYKYKSNIKLAEANLSQAERLPNPSISYAKEDLSSKNIEVNEWTLTGSIPINFIWERWSDINSKESFLESQKLLNEYKKTIILNDVRQDYLKYHYYNKLCKKLNELISELDELTKSANHRYDKGDISEYELQRISVELNKVNTLLASAESETIKYENELKTLLGLESSTIIQTSEPQIFNCDIDESELIELSIKKRNDLSAIEYLIKNAESDLSFNQTQIIPEINLSAGYKKQSDNLKGSVIELDFELPLFQRNQIEIDKSEIQISLFEKERTILIEKVKNEVSESLSSYRLSESLYNKSQRNNYKNMFRSASLSYQYGELSLVEFIDGINAYIDGLTISNNNKLRYISSYYNLETAVGIPLSNLEKN